MHSPDSSDSSLYRSPRNLPLTTQDSLDASTLSSGDPDDAQARIAHLEATIATLQTQVQHEQLLRQALEVEVTGLQQLNDRILSDLTKSSDRYRQILETAPEGIWLLDPHHQISFVNAHLAEMLRSPIEAIVGQAFLSFVYPGSQDLVARMLDRVRQGNRQKYDLRLRRSDGQDLWAIVSITPLSEPDGSYAGALAMVMNISDRKQSQADLEQSLCVLQTTLESTTDGILTIDASGKVLNLNRRFLQQWNLPEAALSFLTDAEILKATLPQLNDPSELLAQLNEERSHPESETHLVLTLNDDRVFERYSKPFRLGDQIVGRVISCRDVTQRRRAEAALAENEALLRMVVTNTPTIVYAVDQHGVFTLCEGKGLWRIGVQPGELVGQSAFEVYRHYPQIIADLQRILTTGQPHNEILELDGLTFDNRVTPIFNDHRDLIGAIGVASDITDRRQAQEELRKAKAELEERVEARTAELQSSNRLLQQEIVQRQQVEESLRESQVCLRLINSISTGIATGLSMEQIVASTVEQTARHFSDLRVLYSVIEADQVEVLHSAQPESMPSLKGLVDVFRGARNRLSISNRRQPIIISDITQEPFFYGVMDRLLARKTRSLLVMPVQHSATQMGLLSFNASTPREWSAYEIATLTELADYLSIVLQEGQAQQERRRAEERLKLFESVVINGNDAVLITNGDWKNPVISYVNHAFTEITGYAAEEVIGKTPRILQGRKTDRAQLLRIRSQLAQGKPAQAELINYRKDGAEFWVDLTIVPISDSTGKLTNFVALQRDINDRKWSETTLMATQARLKFLLSSNPAIVYTCQPNRNRACTFVTDNIAQELGHPLWQYLKDSHFWVDHIHPDDLPNVLHHLTELMRVGELTCEYRFLHADGSYRWLRDAMKLLRDRQGHPVEIVGAVIDISDRKRAETQIRESLEEKEVMLKEIHHRVKNNLQVISSLLKLQAGYIKDDRILEVFKDSQNRVRAMALIHEKLYQSEDLAKTNFAEYIRNLTTDLFRSYAVNSRTVKLDLQVENVRLSIDTAIPCGLIINELVSNSLKYAFPAGRTGIIRIGLTEQAEHRYVLFVHDNGVGFANDLDFQHTKTLGLQLVCNLTKQLHGTIDLCRDEGSQFTITFTESRAKG